MPKERLAHTVDLLSAGQGCPTSWLSSLNQQDDLSQELRPLLIDKMDDSLTLQHCVGHIDLYQLLIGRHACGKGAYFCPETNTQYLYGEWASFIASLAEHWQLLGVESGQTLLVVEEDPLKALLAVLTGFKLGLHVVIVASYGDIYIKNRAQEIAFDCHVCSSTGLAVFNSQLLPCFFKVRPVESSESHRYGPAEPCLSCFLPQGGLYTVTASQFILQRLRDAICVFNLHLSFESVLCVQPVEQFIWLAVTQFFYLRLK
ncbi:hypothetical protein [Piscirickettsia litoralis]|nr:hypothetical protein [Piscirickettsia litoralis]